MLSEEVPELVLPEEELQMLYTTFSIALQELYAGVCSVMKTKGQRRGACEKLRKDLVWEYRHHLHRHVELLKKGGLWYRALKEASGGTMHYKSISLGPWEGITEVFEDALRYCK